MASKGYRQFTILQYERNPKTKEDLHFNESNIISAVSHDTIKKYSYIRHTKDTKTESYDKEEHPDVAVGALIDPHWQVAIKCKNAVEIHTIATWFGVPDNFVHVLRGANAYLDAVEYLTHEHPAQQAKGKHLYDDSEVKSNHDWRKELDAYKKRRLNRQSSNLDTKEYYRNEVLFHGMTLRKIVDEDADAYRVDFPTLEKYRLQYLLQFAEMPRIRINYYVTGKGGSGKGLISRAIARSLYPDKKHDDDIFFEVGGDNVSFEGYDGQPVIIWNDFRAYTLLQALKGRENVFNVFDTHPTNCRQNVKFGSIRLTNEVNIVNSVESVSQFLDGLAGEYKERNGMLRHSEDKGQSYRRFPILIPLHEADFDILLNKGVLEGTNGYEQFVEYKHFVGNMERINRRLAGFEEQIRQVESQVVRPVVDAHNNMYRGMLSNGDIDGQDDSVDIDKLLEEFKDYGKQDLVAVYGDEAKAMQDFIRDQEFIIDWIEKDFANSPTQDKMLDLQKADTAKRMIKENPQEFYNHPEFHLQRTPLTGAYIY